ncbi:hypothetical protein A979_19850 [Pseudomonas syringae BRIP34876]|nr:hypothetical protein A979_19850 [Pseudomonas syringae BRIP34876]
MLAHEHLQQGYHCASNEHPIAETHLLQPIGCCSPVQSVHVFLKHRCTAKGWHTRRIAQRRQTFMTECKITSGPQHSRMQSGKAVRAPIYQQDFMNGAAGMPRKTGLNTIVGLNLADAQRTALKPSCTASSATP